jgi:ubiquinone/menaquinone biosynthesis C-methylase UbiE
MPEASNYLDINRDSWNNKVDIHLASDFYDMDGFLSGQSSLNDIELRLLGDLRGKTVLHLQCHFGQDTLSMGRLGAQVTGVDLSDKAIETARELAVKTGLDATFICCNVYDLPQHLDQQFDVVFTSYGVIGWLPDLDKWAALIARFLKPGGQLVFVEFHPVVWMFDDAFEKIAYTYHNSGPIQETYAGSYADKSAPISQEYVMWNHGLGEVLGSLLRNGLTLNSFEEFDYSPYNCFQKTVEFEPKRYRIEHLGNKIPMVFALRASKKV